MKPSIFIFMLLSIIGAHVTCSQRVVGGHQQRDPEDEEIYDILQKAVAINNSQSNDESINVVKITSATSQVVSGTVYRINFIGQGEISNKLYTGVAEIHSQPWVSPEPKVLSIKYKPIQ